MSDSPDRPYRYGDFPELFWDLKPDVEVDSTDPLIISRVLRIGSLEAVRRLIPPAALAREFANLDLPPHIRDFWRSVLDRLRIPEPSPRT